MPRDIQPWLPEHDRILGLMFIQAAAAGRRLFYEADGIKGEVDEKGNRRTAQKYTQRIRDVGRIFGLSEEEVKRAMAAQGLGVQRPAAQGERKKDKKAKKRKRGEDDSDLETMSDSDCGPITPSPSASAEASTTVAVTASSSKKIVLYRTPSDSPSPRRKTATSTSTQPHNKQPSKAKPGSATKPIDLT